MWWESSMILGKMYQILAEEVIGLNVSFELAHYGSVTDNVRALAGCRNVAAATLDTAECGQHTWSPHQVTFEVWESYHSTFREMNSLYPALAPINLKTYTFLAYEYAYAFPNSLDPAHSQTGLDLTGLL
jgi:hypothetical protein